MVDAMEMNENLCIIAGIHAADGCFSNKGSFIIRDENENNLQILADLINKEFGFLPRVYKTNNENSYQIQFTRKCFWKRFTEMFNFPLGPKTETVRMPQILNEKMKIPFIKGAMTFESSVNINKSIRFSVISKKFRDDIVKILKKKNLKIYTAEILRGGNRKKQFNFRTSESLDSKELNKWLNFYITGSEKWYKIIELSYGFFGKVYSMKDAIKSFKLTYSKGRKIKIYELIDIINNLKQTDINWFFKKLDSRKSTFMKYLNFLMDAKIIKLNKGSQKIYLSNLSENTHLTLEKMERKSLFKKMNKHLGHDAKICRFLNVKDCVYCKWKKGKRGIPLNKLKVMLNLIKNRSKILYIERADRVIIKFNKHINEWRVPWRPWIENGELDKNNEGVKKWIMKS